MIRPSPDYGRRPLAELPVADLLVVLVQAARYEDEEGEVLALVEFGRRIERGELTADVRHNRDA